MTAREQKTKKVLDQCAALILANRFGRACRTFARHFHGSPRLFSIENRIRWAEGRLGVKFIEPIEAFKEAKTKQEDLIQLV